jgi:hypothetical protein
MLTVKLSQPVFAGSITIEHSAVAMRGDGRGSVPNLISVSTKQTMYAMQCNIVYHAMCR